MTFFNTKIICLILALLFALISIPFVGNNLESFVNLTPGNYPLTVDKPILDDYPTKEKMGVSLNSYEDNYKQSLFNLSDEPTNNIKYWETPNNGKCSPAEFCGGLYGNKKIDTPKTPNPLPFTSSKVRVNYYGSEQLLCPQDTL